MINALIHTAVRILIGWLLIESSCMAEYSWYRSYDTQDYWSTDYHQCFA